MKGILIDPRKQVYEKIDIDCSDLKEMYKVLSDPENGVMVRIVERVHLRGNNFLWCDEEARMQTSKNGKLYAFPIHTTKSIIVGKAIVLGTSPSGEEIADTTMSAEEVKFLTGDKLFADHTDTII